MLKGGKTGPSIVPGDAENSLLIRAIRQTGSTLKMPQGGKLKDAEIEDIVAWVNAGAVWPKAAVNTSAQSDGKYVIAPERRNFWSLQPLKDPKPPAVKDARWPKTAIDRFVLAHLEQEGLKQVKPASKHDLLRRATFDLTGLPPTPEEIAAFEKDTCARCLREGRRPPPGLASLRRALGPHLAGRRALWRRRLSQLEPESERLSALSQRLRLPRLGDPGLQRRLTLRCLRQSPTRRRPPR